MTSDDLHRDGCAALPDVYSADEVESLRREVAAALVGAAGVGAIGPAGGHSGARNVLAWWPAAATLWRREPLMALLVRTLGPRFGLVRALYFDKPPGDGWALPWHKDLTVAVRTHPADLAEEFSKPTTKAGVPHLEAPLGVLRRMLTARIHLDAMTDDNGPLVVRPGSHAADKSLEPARPERVVRLGAGSVFLMRPLLDHASRSARPDTQSHRRVLHFEFADGPGLPGGVEWHTFVAG